jgi:hypothetical protein
VGVVQAAISIMKKIQVSMVIVQIIIKLEIKILVTRKLKSKASLTTSTQFQVIMTTNKTTLKKQLFQIFINLNNGKDHLVDRKNQTKHSI